MFYAMDDDGAPRIVFDGAGDIRSADPSELEKLWSEESRRVAETVYRPLLALLAAWLLVLLAFILRGSAKFVGSIPVMRVAVRWLEMLQPTVRWLACCEVKISTVFLVIDHGFPFDLDDPKKKVAPVLWETMVFRDTNMSGDGQWRHRSLAEAVAFHQQLRVDVLPFWAEAPTRWGEPVKKAGLEP